jgi:hypothetical protein
VQPWHSSPPKASAAARDRFKSIGQPMVFGQDIFLSNAGPVWIENPIEYKASKDQLARLFPFFLFSFVMLYFFCQCFFFFFFTYLHLENSTFFLPRIFLFFLQMSACFRLTSITSHHTIGPLLPLQLLNVYSPCSHTPVDYPIVSAAGYHYCKLVSPARAMEHIYLDGLRPRGGHPSSRFSTEM